MERNDEWVGGPLPKIKRVIWRMVPQAGNRRALLERGDADISYELPFKDFQEMKANGKLNVVSLPFSNGIQYIGMNVTKPPFDNPKGAAGDRLSDSVPEDHGRGAVRPRQSDVRRGRGQGDRSRLAAADQIQHRHGEGQGAAGRGRLRQRLRDHDFVRPEFRRRQRAALRAGAGEPRPSSASRPPINKVPGANWRTELNKKEMPLYTNVFSGWLDYPEYFFYWCYHGNNSVFNTMSYKSPDMDKLIDGARTAASIGDRPNTTAT
jgi:peptide/nickel transport system substrate-binding protein